MNREELSQVLLAQRVALYSSKESHPEWFKEIRERLGLVGIKNMPPMTIRKLKVVVDKGAISGKHRNENKREYDLGPFHEVGRGDGKGEYS